MTMKRKNARNSYMVDVRGMLITSKPKKGVKKLATNQMNERDILECENRDVNLFSLSLQFYKRKKKKISFVLVFFSLILNFQKIKYTSGI